MQDAPFYSTAQDDSTVLHRMTEVEKEADNDHDARHELCRTTIDKEIPEVCGTRTPVAIVCSSKSGSVGTALLCVRESERNCTAEGGQTETPEPRQPN